MTQLVLLRLLQASSGGEKTNFEVDLTSACFACAAPWALTKQLADNLKIPLQKFIVAT